MENNSDQRKFPSSSLKAIFASFNEHPWKAITSMPIPKILE